VDENVVEVETTYVTYVLEEIFDLWDLLLLADWCAWFEF